MEEPRLDGAPAVEALRAVIAILCAAALVSSPANAPDPAWREPFLVLATGRSQYRSLYDEAARSYAGRENEALPFLARYLDPDNSREWMALGRIAETLGTRASAPLLAALDAADTDGRRWPLLLALGMTKDSSLGAILATWMSRGDVRVRTAATCAVGDVGDAAAFDALAAALGDSSPFVRRIAADAVQRIRDRGGAPLPETLRTALENARRDPDPWTRRNAVRAIGGAMGIEVRE